MKIDTLIEKTKKRKNVDNLTEKTKGSLYFYIKTLIIRYFYRETVRKSILRLKGPRET